MAEIKWIKIVTNIFDNRKIKQIEKLPEADAIIIIWFKLLCLAGELNENGLIMITQDVPYTDEMLANAFNKPITTIRLALDVFQKFKMIEIINNIYCVSNWEKYQNIEGLDKIREQTRKRVSRYREKQKVLTLGNSNVTCNVTVTQCNETDKEIEKEKKNNKKNNKKKFGEFGNVLLSNDEYEKIKKMFPNDYEIRIQTLDDYIQSKGKKYKDFVATLRNWARKDGYIFPTEQKEYKEVTMTEDEYYKNGGNKKYV